MLFGKKKRNLHDNYKAKELKTFGSKAFLFPNEKKYRCVYDVRETAYIYCEFAFYNKLFDIENWELDLCFICSNQETNDIICNLEISRRVSHLDAITYIREGWGTPEIGWWKAGIYLWEVFIEGILIDTISFYVVDIGLLTESKNPYFDLNNIRLYESPQQGFDYFDRKYADNFPSTARYINVELKLKNKCYDMDLFPLEFIFNCYEQSGRLKGKIHYFSEITDHRKNITLDGGYGTEASDYWFPGTYRFEVIFMDQLIATIPFSITGDQLSNNNKSKTFHNYFNKEKLTEKEVSKNIITLPPKLQTPFLQYLIFFDDYANQIENATIHWNVQKHPLGLEWNVNSTLPTKKIKKHLVDYLKMLYKNEYPFKKMPANETELALLANQLSIQKGHFQQQIFLLQQQDPNLVIDNKFLNKLINQLDVPMEQKKVDSILALKKLVAKDPKLVLEKLQELELKPQMKSDAILLSSRFFLLNNSKKMQLMTQAEYHVEHNKLIHSILQVIDSIYEEDFDDF